MKEYLWGLLGEFVSRPKVASWLIQRAKKRPWYGIEFIMMRYWLLNPYFEQDGNGGEEVKRSWFWNLLPSVRVHFIYGADQDPHMHDHPWDCRTIILDGWYVEQMENKEYESMIPDNPSNWPTTSFIRMPGFTRSIRPLEWHKIERVSPAGAWTLFITWKYKEPWGFLVDGKKMLSRDYFEYRKQWRNED